MLHTQTLTLATTVLLVSLSLFLTFFYHTRRTYPGFGEWTTALFSLATGYVMLNFRGIAPDWLSILLANFLLMTGMALFFDGVLRFSGRSPSMALYGPLHFLSLALVVVLAYYTYMEPSTNARVAVVNTFRFLSQGACVAAMLVFQPKQDRATHRLLGVLFLASAAHGFLRAGLALNASPILHLYDDPTFRLYMLLDLGVVTGTVFCFPVLTHMRVEQELERARATAEQASRTDRLTGLWNRTHFEAEVSRRQQEADRFGDEVCMLMIDIDHFKAINDKFGHLAGDEVLRSVAALLGTRMRTSDLICRWGGEEFIVVLRAPLEAASQAAEDLRRVIAEAQFSVPQPVTISIGVTSRHLGEELASWMARADHALYGAKARGRNCIDVASAQTGKPSPMYLRWNPAFLTGEATLDAQHKALIELAALLFQLTSANDTAASLQTLRKLLDEAHQHYQYEEHVLRIRRYPGLDHHRDGHHRLHSRGEALYLEASQGQADLDDVVTYVLNDLVIRHIAEEDVAFIKHVSSCNGDDLSGAKP